mmetsp:Transcript_8537/g.25369  ORF Transcript_8537/g.25369 Transcript_8537/m.25369 type:complete len:222 (+) Transcript_8537:280-945(+)
MDWTKGKFISMSRWRLLCLCGGPEPGSERAPLLEAACAAGGKPRDDVSHLADAKLLRLGLLPHQEVGAHRDHVRVHVAADRHIDPGPREVDRPWQSRRRRQRGRAAQQRRCRDGLHDASTLPVVATAALAAGLARSTRGKQRRDEQEERHESGASDRQPLRLLPEVRMDFGKPEEGVSEAVARSGEDGRDEGGGVHRQAPATPVFSLSRFSRWISFGQPGP